MWGLFALEEIPSGAFVIEYTGEILTKKEGDKRGAIYDKIGLNYLFDMNDPDEQDLFEMKVQEAFNENFFPLCIDASYCGNESRFINHSCDPNLRSFNLINSTEAYTYHKVGLFASRKIVIG